MSHDELRGVIISHRIVNVISLEDCNYMLLRSFRAEERDEPPPPFSALLAEVRTSHEH